ncbi:MAG: hypothetical protein NTZ93_03380 [Candidatus Beckwithbacteria bacterium]|nr:hypothetical protein [Candidatus Beckwithbacteria bacterium]
MSKRRTREQKIRAKQRVETREIIPTAMPEKNQEMEKRRLIIKDLKKTLLITAGFLIILAILSIWLKL